MPLTINTITPKELDRLAKSGQELDLLDVRTPAEFEEVHVASARNVPLDRLDPESFMSGRNGSCCDPLYVICRSGKRAESACQKLIAAGYENVINVEGGTLACVAAELTVVRGERKVISLERQFRISAGLLVLIGALLGIFLDPMYSILSAIIGAGLVFAGVTDTCPMGMVLARMPWNQVNGECPKCTATHCQSESSS